MKEYNFYSELLISEDKFEDKLRYFLIKSTLEYQLEEYNLSLKSFNESLNYIDFYEDTIVKFMELATIFSEWDNLFNKIKENDKKLLMNSYDNKYIDNFVSIYKGIYYNQPINVEEIISRCETNKQKSIFLYLISLSIKNDDIDLNIEYCKTALQLWPNNLAAAEYLFLNNNNIKISMINRLLDLNKIDFKEVEINTNRNKELNFEFIPLGGGNDIGASSYYMRIEDLNIIIDAGIKINSNTIEYPNYDLLEELQLIDKINYLIITHAHLDHCGAILELWNRNKQIKTIMTRETKELIKLNLKSQGITQDEIYQLEELISKSMLLNFNEEIKFRDKNISIELYKAGHILGAASIMIRSKNCNVFVTGDYCLRDQKTIQGMQLPLEENIDVLITETTYGNKYLERSYLHEYICLQEYIKKSLKKGKHILLPSFAIGRAQEIISLINSISIDEKIRVYIDGSAIQVTKLYEQFTKEGLIKNGNYYVNDDFYSSKEDFIKQEVMTNKCCIVSSSGMLLEGSASSEYSKQILIDDNSVCILTGYQALNTVGARLKEQMQFKGERYIVIDEKKYKILSELRNFHLSAHSSLNEILSVQLYLKANNVILIHGDYRGKPTILEKKLKELKTVNIYQSINNEIIKI